jgi:hypothetical protein
VLGKQLLDAIMNPSLQAIYSQDYVNLIQYLADIGNIVYRTSQEKKRLLSDYDSFHTQMKELMEQGLLTTTEQISYHRTYIKILCSILTVTDDPLEQKELLRRSIDRNQKLLLVKKNIELSSDITFLFKNYGHLYELETDNTAKLDLLEDALTWCKNLSKGYRMGSELRQIVRTHAQQYQKWKKNVLSLRFNPVPGIEMLTILSPSYDFAAVTPGETMLLPSFNPMMDYQMLQKFRLSL